MTGFFRPTERAFLREVRRPDAAPRASPEPRCGCRLSGARRAVVPLALAAVIVVGLASAVLRLCDSACRPSTTRTRSPILNRALAFGKPDLNPHNFLYPTLYFYALFVWEGSVFRRRPR